MTPNITIHFDPSCDGCICWQRDKHIVCDDKKTIRIAKNKAEARAHRGTTERAITEVAMQSIQAEDKEKRLAEILIKNKIDLSKDTVTIKQLQAILRDVNS